MSPRRMSSTSVRSRPNSLEINFTAGYGDNGKTVPEELKRAVNYMVSHLYENRSPVVTGPVPMRVHDTIRAMLDPFKQIRV